MRNLKAGEYQTLAKFEGGRFAPTRSKSHQHHHCPRLLLQVLFYKIKQLIIVVIVFGRRGAKVRCRIDFLTRPNHHSEPLTTMKEIVANPPTWPQKFTFILPGFLNLNQKNFQAFFIENIKYTQILYIINNLYGTEDTYLVSLS